MREGARLLLVRHGRHDWLGPADNRIAGRLPGVSINAQGRAEAEALGRWLAAAPPDRIVSSPLERTMQTATIIGAATARSVVADARLVETDLGPWEGLPVAEIAARDPAGWRAWRTAPTRVAAPGIEPVAAIAERMGAAAEEYLGRGGVTLFVSHQDPLLALCCRLLGLPLDAMRRLEISPGSLTEFEVVRGEAVLVTLNARPPAVPA
ncbi:MAG: histidine phosphatase family protein [Armatimonadota bacterium]|nr:histidine phosphatase family protein [Armatimonadota bacterium]MDR7422605.1 histidine phosphatase family protein [Armatimonadota bacterium]MDR7453572.1 histidine phosphatase family protein [Armatimonadota bacterium]MDR7456382.1 histidine phosphatase family protein [Armatimonadota bacterium]MDR7496678.1 histidine phosphatase family protein [Armatimonadota bacterium]